MVELLKKVPNNLVKYPIVDIMLNHQSDGKMGKVLVVIDDEVKEGI